MSINIIICTRLVRFSLAFLAVWRYLCDNFSINNTVYNIYTNEKCYLQIILNIIITSTFK